MRRDFLKLCSLAGLGFSLTATADNWPQWRGPNLDGISKEIGLLKEWPKEGPPLAWKTTGCGIGYSSVAVVGGRVFTMGDGPDASAVHCFDAKDGRKLWSSADIGKPGGNYPGTRCTPTVDGDALFALGQFGDLVCLDAATGKERWRKEFKRDFGGSSAGWNYTESPLVDGDNVMVTPGGARGGIVALNKRTGELVWQCAEFKDQPQYASLIAADFAGTRQYIQHTMESVVGVDAKLGKLLWRVPRPAERGAVISTPIHANGQIFVTSAYATGHGDVLAISKDSEGFKAAEVWSSKDMKGHHSGVILFNGHLYGSFEGKGFVCAQFQTGKLVWIKPGVLSGGAVACAEGMLYCRNQERDGTMTIVEATPDGYKERGRFSQPDRSKREAWAHPVVANGKLYLRDMDVLLCYDVKAK